MGLLQLCEQYFNTTNLYEVLEITEAATEDDIKKAYHKMSLKVHPDKVCEVEKNEATEKFKIFGEIHTILTDKDKRASYDETKCVDEKDTNAEQDWVAYWRTVFQNVTGLNVIAYDKSYIGSEQEKKDLKQAYLTGKGDMDYIYNQVLFTRAENEQRIRKILSEMIEKGEIPAYEIFAKEPTQKRKRRGDMERQEPKEAAEQMQSGTGLGEGRSSLDDMIKKRHRPRPAKHTYSILDSLRVRSDDDDDDDEDVQPRVAKRKASKGGKSKKFRL